MVKKALSIVAVLLLAGLLLNGITMTQQLKKIHSSLKGNIQSVEKLTQIQDSLIRKNGELQTMTATLDQLDKGLNQTIETTGQTYNELKQVVDYNADSLNVNNVMLKLSTNSKEQIGTVASTLAKLAPALSDMDRLLKQLATIAKQDESHLHDILDSARSMNAKTPEVKLP
jgi:DNA repair exonuclease SbcCD ATPase subunit